MIESGYAGVTSRHIAEKAGLKSQLVHYYFPTMDALFVTLYAQVVEELAQRQDEVFKSPKLARALWDLTSDPKRVALTYEFVALANHRKSIRSAIEASGNRFREGDIKIISLILRKNGFGSISWLPVVAAILLESLARGLTLQNAMGITSGHPVVIAAVDRIIDWLDR